jgi:type IV fimbrial biogenesis protein FimT
MTHLRRSRTPAGLTLIEMLIVVVLAAILLGVAAPSFTEYIKVQRLRGVNAQLVTDVQFARSEAISRNVVMHMRFQHNTALSCYVIYTTSNPGQHCDCTAAEGLRCTHASTAEVRTVQVPASSSVHIRRTASPIHVNFDPRTGGFATCGPDACPPSPPPFAVEVYIDTERALRDLINATGRVTVCKPTGSRLSEPAC